MTDPVEEDEAHLEGLPERFMAALTLKDRGRIDEAHDELLAILAIEPRLPEPRMELARILLDTDRLGDAEPHAREALRLLEAGGQWTEELPENVVMGLAHALLAEILRRIADDDDVIFGDAARFKSLVAESHKHFELAASSDPSDEYASYHAFFLGVDGHRKPST
jgi:tetratricopeptide (TPR) repeat protein